MGLALFIHVSLLERNVDGYTGSLSRCALQGKGGGDLLGSGRHIPQSMTGSTFALDGKSNPIVADDQVDRVIHQTKSNPPMGCLCMANAIAEGFSYDIE